MRAERRLLFAGWLLVTIGVASSGAVRAQAVTTAQSVMFNVDLTGDFVKDVDETWVFNRASAAPFFTNAWNGHRPSVACSGLPPACLFNRIPEAPPAPPPNPTKLDEVLVQNKCAFFNGGFLTGGVYRQRMRIARGSALNFRTYLYTYTYRVSPTVPSVDAGVAWDLQSTDASPAVATLGGFLASQSTVKRTNPRPMPDWLFEVSHTLVDPQGNPRIEGLHAILRQRDPAGGGMVVLEDRPLGTTLETGVDFLYSRNAGHNGAVDALIDGALVSLIQAGNVASPEGDVDDFRGNDTTLGQRLILQQADFLLNDAGNYTLTLSGTLNGIPGSLDLPFAATNLLTISADGCPEPRVPSLSGERVGSLR